MKYQLLVSSKGSPICFIHVGTLHLIKYSPTVLIHLLSPSPDHTQGEVGVVHTKKHTGGENLPTKEPPTGETEVQQETLHKGRKGNPRESR